MAERNPILKKLLLQTREEMEHFLNLYSEQVINGEASLFLGSGVSRNSGFSSWASLLEPLAKEMGIDMGDSPDLYSIAQYYANRNQDSELRRKFSAAINRPAPENLLLNKLLEVSYNSIWTTNYDKLIEQRLDRCFMGYNSISNDMNLASIDKNTKINIYKMNGDISDPQGMVITRDDYEHYAKKHPLFLTFLKKELVANTFLFVGYSFSDALVLDCLSSLREFLGEKGSCHYAVMLVDDKVTPKDEYFFEDLHKRYGIKCLTLLKEDILNVVVRLINKIKEKKVFISGSFDTISEIENNFADELSRELVSQLYENDFRISTGVGKRLGTFVTGYAHQYLAERSVSTPSKFLSMRPFPFHLDLEESDKIRYRKIMHSDCSAAIFLFGQSRTTMLEGGVDKTGHYSRGTYMEYELAKEAGMLIIPVGSTGYEAEIIWNEVKANINEFYYLSKKIDKLKTEKNPAKLVKLIISILNDVPKKNRIN